MSKVLVDEQMLKSLLDAASMTAMRHRGDRRELYVLGQLETTANIAYILTAGEISNEFEAYCQKLACEAIERMETLTLSDGAKALMENRENIA